MDHAARMSGLLVEALDHLDLGVALFDRDLRLRAWNGRLLALLDLPAELLREGASLHDLERHAADRGAYGPGDPETHVARRLAQAREGRPHVVERAGPGGTVLMMRAAPMPEGGLVAVYADVTSRWPERDALAETRAVADRRLGRLRALTRLARAVSASLDLDAVLRDLTAAAGELMRAAAVGFYLADEEARTLELRAFAPADLEPFFVRRLHFGEGMTGTVATTRERLHVPDAVADPRNAAPDRWRDHGLRSFLGVPIVEDGVLLAVLTVNHREPLVLEEVDAEVFESFAFQASVAFRNARLYADTHAGRTRQDAQIALAFADQAALALENARLYGEAERGRGAAELAALARDINATLDPEAVLQRVVEGARALCEADLAHIGLRDPGSSAMTVEFRYWAGSRHHGRQPFRVEAGKGVGGQVLQSGRPFRTDDYANDPRISKDFLPVVESEGIRASLAVPIRIGEVIEGLLFVDSRARPFTDQDEAVLLQLAAHAGVAIRNARLFAREQVAREAAEASEARYRSLFEGVPVGLVRTRPDGRILDANPALVRMLGFPDRAALVATDVAGLYANPGDRRLWQARVEAGPGVTEDETEVRRPDGTTLWVHSATRAVRDAEGRVLHYEGAIEDVTERKRAERRLAVQHAVTRVLAEPAGTAYAIPAFLRVIGEGLSWEVVEFWAVDRERAVLRRAAAWAVADPRVEAFLALGEHASFRRTEGLVGDVWATGAARWLADIATDPRFVQAGPALAAGLRGALAFPVRIGAETLGVISALGREARPPDGALLQMLAAIGSQIGQFLERQRAEETARSGEARKAAVLEAALDCIVTMDHEGRIVEFNPAAERVFGYPREEAIGQPLADLIVPPALRARHRQGLRRYLAEGRGEVIGRRLELQAMRADGSEFPVELTVARIAMDGPPLFTGFVRDVSERRRLEDQLRQAQKMEAVGRLAGGVAHDFNNLLAVVMGHAELMLGVLGEDDPQRESAEEIRRAAERAAALTRQLLAFSRRQLIKPQVLDLNALVAGITSLLRRLIGEDVQLETRLQPGLSSVRADPGQIEQVLMNLAVNARDAMPEGGRLILETANVTLDEPFVRAHAGAAAGPHVCLTATDTGCGMSEETRMHLFEPFFTTKAPGKGTGLGLSTVYGIVKQHRGYVEVETGLGRGATFRIYLPRIEARPEAMTPPAALAAALRGAETILVAEDEPAVRDLVRRVLVESGYTVLVASDGPGALEVARRYPATIQVLLTDVVMPEMSGRDLAERLRAVRPETRVLYVSGYTDDALGPHGVLDPETPILLKPFTPEALLTKLREVIKPEGGGMPVAP